MAPHAQPPVLVTPGDPAGIGGEIALRAKKASCDDFCLIENASRMTALAQTLDLDVQIQKISQSPGIQEFRIQGRMATWLKIAASHLPPKKWARSQALHRQPCSWCEGPVARTHEQQSTAMTLKRQVPVWFWTRFATRCTRIWRSLQRWWATSLGACAR